MTEAIHIVKAPDLGTLQYEVNRSLQELGGKFQSFREEKQGYAAVITYQETHNPHDYDLSPEESGRMEAVSIRECILSLGREVAEQQYGDIEQRLQADVFLMDSIEEYGVNTASRIYGLDTSEFVQYVQDTLSVDSALGHYSLSKEKGKVPWAKLSRSMKLDVRETKRLFG